MTTGVKITEEPSTTYKIRNLEKRFGWADITLREWKGGGSFQCQSDYGDYAHIWGSIGKRTFKEFLCKLDKDYFLKKTRPRDYMVFDNEGTCNNLKEEIIRARREGELTKETARECWVDVEEMEAHACHREDDFWYHFNSMEIYEKLYFGDVYTIPTHHIYNPECDAFWENVWPHITEYWKNNP